MLFGNHIWKTFQSILFTLVENVIYASCEVRDIIERSWAFLFSKEWVSLWYMRFVVVGCEWVWEWLLAVGVYWWSLASACQSTWSTQWSPVKTWSLALHSLCKFILLWKSLRTCWCGLCRWLRRLCLLKTHQSASASKSSSCISHSKADCCSANPPAIWLHESRDSAEVELSLS